MLCPDSPDTDIQNTAFHLRCPSCQQVFRPSRGRFVCDCGTNLEVIMELNRLDKARTIEQIKSSRDYSIWRYLPLLPVPYNPAKPDPSLGWTPVYNAEKLARTLGISRLYIKDDGRNPSGSFKDRASAVVLSRALSDNEPVIVGASTGNAASSTACLASTTGIKTVIFVPCQAPEAKIAQLLVFGATVIKVRGTYDDAFDLSLEATRRFGWYNRNTGFNPYTREGKKTCAFELWEQLGDKMPEYIFVPVGDGNILSGIYKGFKELLALGAISKIPRLIAVQARNSDAVIKCLEQISENYQPGHVQGSEGNKNRGGDMAALPDIPAVSGKTVADSISVSVPRDGQAAVRAVLETDGFGIRVSDKEILAEIPTTAQLAGIFGEPAGVAAIAGIRSAVSQGLIDHSATIGVIVTGNGLKDVRAAISVSGPAIEIDADAVWLNRIFEEIKA